MFPMDLRCATFTCKTVEGEVFETDDINLIGAPMGEVHFWVDDKECESVTVEGVDFATLGIVGETMTRRIVPADNVNSVSFNENEGIYTIDGIPCQKATLERL